MAKRRKRKPFAGKGPRWERDVAIKLSLWVTSGERKDVFWRSAMSGGRATVLGAAVRQCGDICAVAAEGHWLTDNYFIECKHRRDLAVLSFFLHDKGLLAKFWHIAQEQAKRHNRKPLLIAKQNNLPPLFVVESGDPYGDACWRCHTSDSNAVVGLFADLLQMRHQWTS